MCRVPMCWCFCGVRSSSSSCFSKTPEGKMKMDKPHQTNIIQSRGFSPCQGRTGFFSLKLFVFKQLDRDKHNWLYSADLLCRLNVFFFHLVRQFEKVEKKCILIEILTATFWTLEYILQKKYIAQFASFPFFFF